MANTNDKTKNPHHIIMMVVVALLIGGASFWSGMQYQKSQARDDNGNFRFGQSGQMMMRVQNGSRNGGRGFGGANVGEIVSMDNNSITIKLQDGSSKIINVSDKTTISKTDTASKSDLKAGERIAAFGTPNSDGSIDAQNIQLNPMFRMGGRGGQGGQPSPNQ